MTAKLTIEQLLKMTREEQNAYLATLPEKEAEKLATEIFQAQAKADVQKLVDNLNSNTKPSLTEEAETDQTIENLVHNPKEDTPK